MDFENIKELIKLVDSSDLAFFELSTGDNHIKMDKSLNRSDTSNSNVINSSIPVVKTVEKIDSIDEVKGVSKKEIKGEKEEEKEDSSLTLITSPMVGTFYSAASPEAPALTNTGDIVSKGKVLCIIEAMKLMNEIESEYNGEIVECLVKNGDMVEYGQPLFKIKEV